MHLANCGVMQDDLVRESFLIGVKSIHRRVNDIKRVDEKVKRLISSRKTMTITSRLYASGWLCGNAR